MGCSFAAAQNYPVGGEPVSVVLGDINGDGRLDIVTANLNSNNISVLFSTCGVTR
jgi:hypothetical protein